MTTEVIIALIGVLSTITGSWTSWFFARKKYNSEVDNNLIENMQKSLEFYKKLSDDNKERLDEVLKRNEDLESQVEQLRNQVFSLMQTMCIDMTCEYRKQVNSVPNINNGRYVNPQHSNKKGTRNEAEASKKV